MAAFRPWGMAPATDLDSRAQMAGSACQMRMDGRVYAACRQ